jgi:predicted FMN-binding regulatory protein PaiB
MERMMRAIVGIEIPIDRLEGKLKASQDEAMPNRLGTVRDIVGRLLKNFEQRELVSLGRERIRVLNAEGLKELAERQG